ncbi:MAG: VWA domain-containing protein [Calditrichaeota bacterium]|nr:MAG: VWA domain-containing protein [Calditrichota bacterium]
MMKNYTIHCLRDIIKFRAIKFLLLSILFLVPFEGKFLYGIQTQDYNVELLNLDTSNFPEIIAELRVRTSDSLVVSDLDVSQFTVWEDQIIQPQRTLSSFGGDSGGAAIAMIMDISSSMDDDLPAAKVAAIDFVNMLNDLDQSALISFDRDAVVRQPFTHDKQLTINAINALVDGSGTALYDAIITGLDLVRPIEGKKALVVVADGNDNKSSTDLDELVALAANEGIPIYLIGLGRTLDAKSAGKMEEIATASGGLYYSSPTTAELERIYTEIAYLISNQYYVLNYRAENCIEDGSTRNLNFEVNHEGYHGEFSIQYTAPGHYVTFKPTVVQRPHAGENFHLNIEVPASSLPLFNMLAVNFTVSYDPAIVKLVEPYDTAILSGGLLGNATTHSFDYNVRASEGQIDFSIAMVSSDLVLTGNGSLAEIVFETDSSAIDSTTLAFSISDVTSQNTRGCEVALTIEDEMNYTNGMWVWPGDTNHNGTVELSDVLRLGLFWAMQGPARPEVDPIAWKAQSANKYTKLQATFADADGGGEINERDLIPIAVNWALTSNNSAARPDRAVAKAALAPQGRLSVNYAENEPGSLKVLNLNWANSAAPALAGLTFRINYPPQKIDSIAILPGNGWPSQPLVFSHNDKQNGLLAAGVMLSGGEIFPHEHGKLVSIQVFAAHDEVIGEIEITDIALVGAQGQIRDIAKVDVQLNKKLDIPQRFQLHPAYPNPFNPSTKIVYETPEPARITIHVFNSVGQLLRSAAIGVESAGTYSYLWHGRDFSGRQVASGTYFVEVVMMGVSGERHRGLQKVSFIR